MMNFNLDNLNEVIEDVLIEFCETFPIPDFNKEEHLNHLRSVLEQMGLDVFVSNEIFEAMHLLALFTGRAYYQTKGQKMPSDEACRKEGKKLLDKNAPEVDTLRVIAQGFENSKREVVILKVRKAYAAFKEMILYYSMGHIVKKMNATKEYSNVNFINTASVGSKRENWINLGGQLIAQSQLNSNSISLK